jgi:hypothetical protein
METPETASTPEPPVEPEVEAIMKRLSAPFDPTEVKFKPAVVSGQRALALAYVDARVIQDRLDEVLGVTGWQDEYECLPDGSVVCRLRLRLGDEWITKMDVGGPSEQPDGGDRMKAAFSDALKRAAVKFGVGRYLYRLPQLWVDYDPQRRQFLRPPMLPEQFQPAVREEKKGPRTPRAPKPMPAPVPPVAPKPAAVKPPTRALHTLPANGDELQRRLYDYDSRLAKQGVCEAGALVKHIVSAGVKAGFDPDLSTWTGPAIALAVEETKAFETAARQCHGEQKVA